MEPNSRSERVRDRIDQLLAWLALAMAAGCVFLANQRFGSAVMGVAFQDDFYYYATVARNLALHGRSTFDGIHLTNGYHPLWLGILTVLMWLSRASDQRFALMVECVQSALLGAAALFAFRIARRFCSVPWAVTIQLLAASVVLIQLRSGMESGLAVAAGLALLAYRTSGSFSWTTRRAFLYGLLAATLILSRLDAGLLVLLLMVFDVTPAARRREATRTGAAAFVTGLFPVALYLCVNAVIFGAMLPLSGTAKQLRRHHTPSVQSLSSFREQIFHGKSPVYGLFAVLVVVALVSLLARRSRTAAPAPGVIVAVLLFPFVQMLLVSCMSDWPVWDWYLYPWPIAGVFACGLLVRLAAGRIRLMDRAGQAAFAVSLVLFATYTLLLLSGTNPAQSLTYLAGKDVQRFAAEHPGRYAMGDRAGAVGYLSSEPPIQLEGLMMDKPFLQNIREEKDLRTVLRSYGVRYYISTEYPDKLGRCVEAREPVQAGPDSPVMRGTICGTPLAVFPHGYLTNRIFDVSSPD
ncbi:hypothetical protein SAMN05421819_4445 [Bryocella elongata]|uniref:Dolichyl-phosphate-mannose-protein mannosyltransferase n=1 Tax=Bryocella elongata TaxID=863522 RepID=A0A1H6CD28_9BACT|nr:hypothetical protein [Bryocella elongata]SEG70545.1 hypothetical protein SAMN05421819_4445 [Bryocella elongata]